MRLPALTALLLLAAASARAEDCTLKRIAVIPFEQSSNLIITIPATIQDREIRVLIDTGGAWSLLDKDLAEELKLPKRYMETMFYDGAGKPLDQVVRVRGMMLANVKVDVDLDFLVSSTSGNKGPSDWRATLGVNLFNAMDLEIDNAAKKLSLFSTDHCRGAGVYWADEAVTLEMRRNAFARMPIVDADLNGEKVRVLFDTGASMTSMSAKLAKRKFGITSQSPGATPGQPHRVASGKRIETFEYIFDKLQIAGVTFENVRVAIGNFDDDGDDMILGMHEMRHLRLYFAFRDRLIHITAADAGREAPPPGQR